MEDLRFLYALLKERPRKANISHTKIPTWEEHVAFVRSEPYREWFVIWCGPHRVGSIYLTKAREVGVFIMRRYQRRGFAAHAVKWIVRRYRGQKLLANVAPGNKPSMRLFKALGWRHIQNTYEH